MAWRQRHLVHLARIPCAYEHPSGVRVVLYRLNDFGELVDFPAVRGWPTAPLMSVYRAQISVLVGPFIPNGHFVLLKILDVGISAYEP